MTPDHSALIERLDLIVAELEGLPHVKQTVAESAAALRDQQSKMQMMQARLDRWEPKPFCGPSFSSSFLTGQAEQPSDASRIFRPSAGSAGPLPSAPNQAKEAEEIDFTVRETARMQERIVAAMARRKKRRPREADRD